MLSYESLKYKNTVMVTYLAADDETYVRLDTKHLPINLGFFEIKL